MTRARLSLAAVLALVVASVLVVTIARSDAPPSPVEQARPSKLVLLVLNTDTGPLTAVVGSRGSGAPAGLVLPGRVDITIPGQGDATIGEAAGLTGREAATAAANLLGVWIPHYAVFGQGKVATIIDRAGGIEIGGTPFTGAEAVGSLLAAEGAREEVWSTTLQAVLSAGGWEAADLPQADSPTAVAELLNAARGATVELLPTEEVTGGLLRTEPETIRAVVTAAFGVPDREVVPVITLNGSGEPGIGERAAERIIPGGFRIVISENASSFDHETTIIVVGVEEDRPLGERVRDLLGVGEVQVAGPASGLADVTIVIGKDFSA